MLSIQCSVNQVYEAQRKNLSLHQIPPSLINWVLNPFKQTIPIETSKLLTYISCSLDPTTNSQTTKSTFHDLFGQIKTNCTIRVSVFLFFNQKEELDKKFRKTQNS